MDTQRKGLWKTTVTEAITARAMGSGSLAVLATPALVALMEHAACQALADMLEEGVTTVGTRMDVNHVAATPVGMDVWAEAVLTAQEGRRYAFEITAYDAAGVIGTATHERMSVQAGRFLARAESKKGTSPSV